MNCKQLQEKINELIDKEKQGRSGMKGLKQRFRDYIGDDATHGPAIIQQQGALLAYSEEFINKGCGPPPPGVYEWVDKPLPEPEGEPSDTMNKLVTVGAGAAVGYIAYRVIRFLPSLLPPLWPSIPANLAVP